MFYARDERGFGDVGRGGGRCGRGGGDENRRDAGNGCNNRDVEDDVGDVAEEGIDELRELDVQLVFIYMERGCRTYGCAEGVC